MVTTKPSYGEQIVDQGLAALQGAQSIAVSAVEGAFDTAHKVLSAQRSLVSDLLENLSSKASA